MIALDIQRTRFALMAVESAARKSRNLLVVDGGHAIANHRDIAPNEGNVIALPLPRPRAHRNCRSDKPVDGSHAVVFVVGARWFVLDLDFIAPAQVHSAVSVLRAVVFAVQLDILEL